MLWIEIKDFKNYLVSSSGLVKSLPRLMVKGNVIYTSKEKILKQCIDSVGYKYVCLFGDSNKKTLRVHNIVANAFLEKQGPNSVVNHKDGDCTNNEVSNLEFVSSRENSCHFYKRRKSSSKYIGVSYDQSKNKWKASAYLNNKLKNLGCYDTEELAGDAYHKFLIDNNITNKYAGSKFLPSCDISR